MKKQILFLVTFVIIAGCTSGISSQELIEKVSSANQNLTSYKFDSTTSLSVELSLFGQQQSSSGEFILKGSVDAENKKVKYDATITSQDTELATTVYIIDNVMYTLLEGNWTKDAAENVYDTQNIYDSSAELLASSKIKVVGSEVIGGKETYVVKITPDLKKLLEQAFGQLGTSSESQFPPGVKPENLIKQFSLKLWIEKDTFLIVKSDMSMLMEIDDEKTGQTLFGMDMKISTRIYDHNEPVVIELPAEALSAT